MRYMDSSEYLSELVIRKKKKYIYIYILDYLMRNSFPGIPTDKMETNPNQAARNTIATTVLIVMPLFLSTLHLNYIWYIYITV